MAQAWDSSSELGLKGDGVVTEKPPGIGVRVEVKIGRGLRESPSMRVMFGFEARCWARGVDALRVRA